MNAREKITQSAQTVFGQGCERGSDMSGWVKKSQLRDRMKE